MNIKSVFSSIERVVLGIFLLILIIAVLIGYSIGYAMRKPNTTVIVERPDSPKAWWGHYGAGLPGWGGDRAIIPPPPSPHPRPPMPPGAMPPK